MIEFYPLRMVMPMPGRERSQSLPLMAAAVRLSSGLVLVDSGFVGQPTLFDQLALHGIATGDIDLLLNTHVHPDHVGNNRHFPHCPILLSRIDYEFQRDYAHAMLETGDVLGTFQRFYPEFQSKDPQRHALQAQLLVKNYWCDDVIGPLEQVRWFEEGPSLPPEIRLWPTPGHTPGHHAIEIIGAERSLLISGDAMPGRLFWGRRLRERAPRFNNEAFEESKKRIESFHGLVMGGHDSPFDTETLLPVLSSVIHL
jgi:glyoxylase-like metal-dependent hydrolase (beta-lactamase superfamily II)